MSAASLSGSVSGPPSAVNWLRRYRNDRQAAAVRLVCFPHAGGGASFYRRWASLLPDTYEHLVVQYPGHEDRLADDCIAEMHQLADPLAEVLLPLTDRPLILFGHSMGASVAYEVARRLQEQGHPPQHLVASGRMSPTRQRPGRVHLLEDEAFLKEIAQLGGVSDDVLRHPELRDLVLHPIRNDYRLIETYRPMGTPALDCPITTVRGMADLGHTEDEARAWAEVGRGDFRFYSVPGGHFYLAPDSGALIQLLLGRFGSHASADA
ncbi:thioesterase [Streptomyces sp. RPA4-5]|uniref:thioesterase II family protein n=1 Tax=Streptomyces sp. RPA4-5 TaxID=2721245 RepID=UPI00143E7792|nr:alpha/beta fold hydrolase [Streptomyces sp. RPA4-5]QIY54440.1 thioesterase [Streptomyces sp. RPA4-5]